MFVIYFMMMIATKILKGQTTNNNQTTGDIHVKNY